MKYVIICCKMWIFHPYLKSCGLGPAPDDLCFLKMAPREEQGFGFEPNRHGRITLAPDIFREFGKI